MTVRLTFSRRAVPRALLLAASVALVPLPLAAADSAPTPKTRKIDAAMQRIVERDLRTAGKAPAVKARAAQGGTAPQSAGFFRTRTGVVIAAVMIAGTGYALYSAQHDRIHSAGKE